MKTKIVYLFDENNRVFTHSYEAQESPEDPGVFIEPIDSCPDHPPETQVNEAAQRNIDNTAWSVVTDFRGHIFYDQVTGEPMEIIDVGIPASHLGPTQPPPVPTVPQFISRFQGFAQLHKSELLEQVQAIMDDPATDPLTVIAWNTVQEFRRQSPIILAMAPVLELSDEDLDQLFTAAKLIEG